MPFLDTRRFDRLTDEEVLDRIGGLLAIAVGRRASQRTLNAHSGTSVPLDADSRTVARLDLAQLVTDPDERKIIAHLRSVGRTSARDAAAAFGLTRAVAAQKLARLCAAGLCRMEPRSQPACYRLRAEFSEN